MREGEVSVTFEPQGKKVFVLPGTKILEAAARAGIILDTPCGGQGTCGKCKVRATQGSCEPNNAERATLSAEEIREGFRLACQSAVERPITVEVPESSWMAAGHRILTATRVRSEAVEDPVIRKEYVELGEPGSGDSRADLDRLTEMVGECCVDLRLLREMPGRLRRVGFRGTAVLADHQLIDFEDGDTEGECFSVAVDLGTTTLVAQLLESSTGKERAVTSRMNPQTSFGDDVLSRILHARECPECLAELCNGTVSTVNEMIRELSGQAGVREEHIYEVVFSGNTTMQQLLCGIDPSALGEVPFAPASSSGLLVKAAELGLHIHHSGTAYIFPIIAGFVGGDTVAGILATALGESGDPLLLVDLGTNGEIVLSHDGRLMAASTAAGPAFEGARISHGMRASRGAIEKILFDSDVRLNVIGNAAPVGMCGSGLIDLGAGLLRLGLITGEGRLLPPEEAPADVPQAIQERVIWNERQVEFVLVRASESGSRTPITLTQRDVRELQLACGAIRAGVTILFARAGLRATDIKKVLIAGGFGNFIRRSNAQRIGLLPAELQRRRISFAGNTSLAGARLVALSRAARQRAEEIAQRTEHISLSGDADFQSRFAEAMLFPSAGA